MQIFTNLTELQQGELLVAQYNGRALQYWSDAHKQWIDRQDNRRDFFATTKYRIKDIPIRTYHMQLSNCKHYEFRYTKENDVVDFNSVKMHESVVL